MPKNSSRASSSRSTSGAAVEFDFDLGDDPELQALLQRKQELMAMVGNEQLSDISDVSSDGALNEDDDILELKFAEDISSDEDLELKEEDESRGMERNEEIEEAVDSEIGRQADNEEERMETPCKKRPRLDDSYEQAMEILENQDPLESPISSQHNQNQTIGNLFCRSYASDDENEENYAIGDLSDSDVNSDIVDEEDVEETETVDEQDQDEGVQKRENEMENEETACQNGGEERGIRDTEHDNEIEALLEGPVDEQKARDKAAKTQQMQQGKIWKTVLDRLDEDYFERLPEGWMRVTHHSGMPLYLHRPTRVVTWSRPYCIGRTSVRNHSVPLAAVPCLHRKRVDERIATQKDNGEGGENPPSIDSAMDKATEDPPTTTNESSRDQSSSKKPIAKILHAPPIQLEKQEDYILRPYQLRQYCEGRFKFMQIPVTKYRSFRERTEKRGQRRMEAMLRKAGVQASAKEVADYKDMETIQGASGMRLIKIPTIDGRFHKKNYVLNPVGKSPVNILNEYVQRAFSGKIFYTFEDARNVITPFLGIATLRIKKEVRLKMAESVKEKLALMQERSGAQAVDIDNSVDNSEQLEDVIIIGRGLGIGKKKAKMAAAKDALATLIPNLKFDEKSDLVVSGEMAGGRNTEDEKVLEVFDNLEIEDKRVADYCARANQSKPLALLKEAINRSIKWREIKLDQKAVMIGNQKTKVNFTLGELTAEVVTVGTKKGMQLAAQSLLKQMHPDFKSYGSLLRRYANQTEKQNRRQAQRHHDEVVRLQNHGSQLQPNHAVISKLQEEMMKIELLSQQRPGFMNLPKNIPW